VSSSAPVTSTTTIPGPAMCCSTVPMPCRRADPTARCIDPQRC
jgi:hypothetical protein